MTINNPRIQKMNDTTGQELKHLMLELMNEIKTLREEVSTMNKVFAFKGKKVTRKEKEDNIRARYLASRMV